LDGNETRGPEGGFLGLRGRGGADEQHMTLDLAQPVCPLAVAADVSAVRHHLVPTGTACLALMDLDSVDAVWQDLLYDGHDHEHAAGGLMLNGASLGLHVDYDGQFPVAVLLDAAGLVRGLRVDLDPYRDDLDSLRRPANWTPAHEQEPLHGQVGHGHDADGWSAPAVLRLLSARALLGDPAGLPQADGTGGLLPLTFPTAGGLLSASVRRAGGLPQELLAVWSAG
jgi:hypothetical protein